MTVCNMSIEAGARAGLIAPDETTFDLPQGPPARAAGRRLGRGGRVLADAATDEDAVFDREVTIDATTLTPVRHLGHQPRPGRCRSAASVPDAGDFDDRATERAAERALQLHGPDGRHAAARRSRSTRSSSAPAPTAGSRTCAPPPTSSRAARSPTASGCWSSPARCGCARRPRPRGSTRSSRRPVPSGAAPAARCAWA